MLFAIFDAVTDWLKSSAVQKRAELQSFNKQPRKSKIWHELHDLIGPGWTSWSIGRQLICKSRLGFLFHKISEQKNLTEKINRWSEIVDCEEFLLKQEISVHDQ